jgi:GxxExxY protein
MENAFRGRCAEYPAKEMMERIVGAAIEIHRALGPGLRESAYQACLAREFEHHDVPYRREVELPVTYRDLRLDTGYRLDFIVETQVIVELKSVERIMPIHEAQRMTYFRLAELPVGLLINFNVPKLRDGIVRRVI